MEQHILDKLYDVLQERKSADPKKSYAAKLYKKGTHQIAKKLGEEATELVIDAVRLEEKPKSKKARARMIGESADLLFHFLVLLSHHDISPHEVFGELEERLGIGGLEEKASRQDD